MRKPKKNQPGYLRQKNAMKRQSLERAIPYIESLEKENEALRGDPNTYIGQFIGQFREMYSQNSRLSVLAAALIKRLNGKVTLTKEEMTAFENNRINIKWELPEGVEKIEDAAEYVFSYELQPVQQPGAPQAATVVATETPEHIAVEDVVNPVGNDSADGLIAGAEHAAELEAEAAE
jgi:hypothetical protein